MGILYLMLKKKVIFTFYQKYDFGKLGIKQQTVSFLPQTKEAPWK